jgi:mRNA interferase MazF
MSTVSRGEIWLADLGFLAKVRPVLVLSAESRDDERAIVTYVARTTSLRGTRYEVLHSSQGFAEGAFDAQGIGSVPQAKLIRKLGRLDAATLVLVENAVRAWLHL